MDILVCVKQILDPDIPSRDFQIDNQKMEADRGNADLVPNIFCENALETALQLRDEVGGQITAISFGGEETEDALRKALAMRVDEAVLVDNKGSSNPNPLTVARVLAQSARKLGDPDLILVGRESGDWGVGQTGGLLAEELGLPFVGFVDQIEKEESATGDTLLRLRRQTDTGFDIVEAVPPVVAGITNSDGNLPRIPKTRDVMMSYRKPLAQWSLDDLGLSEESKDVEFDYYCLKELSIPEKHVDCQFAEGDSLEEQVSDFAGTLKKIIESCA